MSPSSRRAPRDRPDARSRGAADPWAEAGRKILRFHLARMLAHVPDRDRWRPTARRSTTCGSPPGASERRGESSVTPTIGRSCASTSASCRTLGDRLGAVRDLDVQLAIVSDVPRPSLEARTRRAGAAARCLDRRASGRATPISRRTSPRPGSARSSPATRRSSGRTAPTPLQTRPMPRRPSAPVHRRSRGKPTARSGPSIRSSADADVATLHELRIATKWLRYTLEFVREPMEPAATELIRRVVVLQDHLGDIHDLHAAAGIARRNRGRRRPICDRRTDRRSSGSRSPRTPGSTAFADGSDRPGEASPTPSSDAAWDARSLASEAARRLRSRTPARGGR